MLASALVSIRNTGAIDLLELTCFRFLNIHTNRLKRTNRSGGLVRLLNLTFVFLALACASPAILTAGAAGGGVRHPSSDGCDVWEFDLSSDSWRCMDTFPGGGHQVGDLWCSGPAREHAGWTVQVRFIQQAYNRSECAAWLFDQNGEEAPEGGWLGNGDCDMLCKQLVVK